MATRRFGRFRGDAEGSVAIEFAIIAVPFLGLLAMIFDFGLAFFFERNLDAAVQDAARQIRTGAMQAGGVATTKDFVSKYVCPAGGLTGAFIDCSKLIVDVRTSASFAGNDMSNSFYKTPTSNTFCLGAPHTVTVVRVAYPMPWFIPVVGYGGVALQAGLVNDVPNMSGWYMLLISASAVRTEPYPTANYAAYQTAKGC